MKEDIFYTLESELVDTQVSVHIIQLNFRNIVEDETFFKFLMECKDPIMLEVYAEYTPIDIDALDYYNNIQTMVVESLSEMFPNHEYTVSFSYDDINVVVPNKSFTIDRIISMNPLKLSVLLREYDTDTDMNKNVTLIDPKRLTPNMRGCS